jgi:hypothetical protein
VEEQPTYHNCASLCSVCEGKGRAKIIYMSLFFVSYRNYNQNAADDLFGLLSMFVSVSGDCEFGTHTLNDFDWIKLVISVLTSLV